MDIVFIHQNMPGQYRHLASALADGLGHRVVFITKRGDRALPGVRRMTYKPSRVAGPPSHHYLLSTENGVLHGQAVARALMELKSEGFRPDLVIGHPGWGETLFVKDVFPGSPYLNYCEFFYRARGLDAGFDPDHPMPLDAVMRLRMRTTPLLLALEACERGIAPTQWQRASHPQAFQAKIETIHDGIDTERARPNPAATVTLPGGRALRPGDEVVTYAVRNLEPYRGFPSFIRALPAILERRPKAEVVILGGDATSYGPPPTEGQNWRQRMLDEVALDKSRVHFLGHLPYERYLDVLAVSRVHVYLTYPFVLSWSMLEAMASGCALVASDTGPVREVVSEGETGLLVDFFSPGAIAERVVAVLEDPGAFAHLGPNARALILERFALERCLAAQHALVEAMAGG